jgi:hypothetical protein
VKLHKLGYKYQPEGRKLILLIASYINSRYSTNINSPVSEPSFEIIQKVLSGTPPIDISTGKSHFTLSREYTILKGGRKGFPVHVYKEGVEIELSPFRTYGEAQIAIGLPAKNRTVSRYIDTGKLYKGLYIFCSKPM